MESVNIPAVLAAFDDIYSPRIVARVNDYEVRVAHFAGEHVWHVHDDTDEFFLVLDGAIEIAVRDAAGERAVPLSRGDVYVVPRGVEHKPSSSGGGQVLMFEPAGTVTTGDRHDELPAHVRTGTGVVVGGWDDRLAAHWSTLDDQEPDAFRSAMDALVAELPADDPVGPFEQASAFDSTGHSDRAVPLYRRALALGLTGIRRRRATIQLASSLRNLGQADESVALLTAELDAPSDELDDAVRATLALALTSVGREREAVSHALTALAPHLARYNRSMANYAAELA